MSTGLTRCNTRRATPMMGIYGLYCEATDKWYVGASEKIETRIKEHWRNIRDAMDRNCYRTLGHPMGEDAYQFGIETIRIDILEEVPDKGDLIACEMYWVRRLDSVRDGYNRHEPFQHWSWGNE